MNNPQDQTSRGDNSQPKAILSAWYALEVLSPQTFNKPEDFANEHSGTMSSLDFKGLPWENGNNTPPNEEKDIFYHILLGCLNMHAINELLIKKFSEGFEEKFKSKQKAALAFITVDAWGRIKDETNIAVSSFAWGYPQVLKGNLKNLNEWSAAESGLKSHVFNIFFDVNEKGERSPIIQAQINRVFEYLMKELEIPSEHILKSVYFIKTYKSKPKKKKNDTQIEEIEYEKKQKYPEPPLLNSFYLKDLVKSHALFAAEDKEPGTALRLYLGDILKKEKIDILKDTHEFHSLLSPGFDDHAHVEDDYEKIYFMQTPAGRWPTPGGHSMILLQQAAVNAAVKELANEGLMGINGPPGTGKTTLLRDTIASVLINRAQAMIKFDDPEKAFIYKGKITAGQSFLHMYDVDETLKGFEMIVASSNNKAVENIAKELPLMTSINQDLSLPRYFRTTSDKLNEKGGNTWGLIAAVMGNSSNQKAFRDVFWNKDVGLQNYLKAATGQDVSYEDKCEKTGKSTRKIPQIIIDQPPPQNKEDALKRWEKARQKFNNALENIIFLYRVLKKGADHSNFHFLGGILYVEGCVENQRSLEEEISDLEQEILMMPFEIDRLKSEILLCAEKIAAHKSSTLNPIELFFGGAYKALKEERKLYVNRYSEAENTLIILKETIEKKKKEYVEKELETINAKQNLEEVIKYVEQAKEIAGKHFADDDFWKRLKDTLHKSTAWLSADVQECRDDVFIAAMEVHQAFIDAAAKPIRHNLMAHSFVGKGGDIPRDLQDFIPSAWQTLFMVVPVISTTFASVATMLKDFGPNSLGWLFVDEAGQATPQAAVGAIMRAKRVVMVGDPLQIEPIIPLSNKLIRSICEEFKVEADLWAPPLVSAQSCADRASRYGTRLEKDGGDLWVGFPLLVHRRCEEPMFGISNEAAYNNLMIHATPKRSSKIRDIIGESKWFHLRGSTQDKWCPEEGEFVVRLLKTLVNNGITDPDIYIITPFRDIAYKMRLRLRQEKALFERMQKNAFAWLNERVGTVHTFQGKEAEAVFMVLGTQDRVQHGARSWAGERPNLVNVAVTRAKSAFYVIGNHSLWSECGTFGILSKTLPLEESNSFKDKAA